MEEYKASGSEEAVNVDVKLNNGISENNKKKRTGTDDRKDSPTKCGNSIRYTLFDGVVKLGCVSD